MSFVDAVREEIDPYPAGLAPGLRALAVVMAERIDERVGSPSECGKVLKEALRELRDLAPPRETVRDGVDDLAKRRHDRRAQAS